ncbi:hypothetical protein LCGC14_3019160, partial [marine sediment metagenome]
MMLLEVLQDNILRIKRRTKMGHGTIQRMNFLQQMKIQR